MTWKDLIKLTLQDLRILGVAAIVTAEQENLALLHLNDWIDSQKNDFGAVSEMRRTTWNLTGAASYAVGTGATVNVQRPVSPQMIAGLGFINANLSGSPEMGLDLPLAPSEWQGIPYKSQTGPYPARWFYEATMSTGLLYPYPIPTTGSLQGVMYSGVQVDEITNLVAVIALPPGYRLWLRKALKLELADPFRVPVGEEQLHRWKTERDEIAAGCRRQNERLEQVSFGFAGAVFGSGSAPSNIYTGR